MRTLISILFFILFMSCTTHRQTVQIPVELQSIQTCYDRKVLNVFVIDSVSRWTQGDSVYIYRERTKILNVSDTLIKKDSIPTAVRLESTDEISIEYLDKLGELKSLMFKMLLP